MAGEETLRHQSDQDPMEQVLGQIDSLLGPNQEGFDTLLEAVRENIGDFSRDELQEKGMAFFKLLHQKETTAEEQRRWLNEYASNPIEETLILLSYVSIAKRKTIENIHEIAGLMTQVQAQRFQHLEDQLSEIHDLFSSTEVQARLQSGGEQNNDRR